MVRGRDVQLPPKITEKLLGGGGGGGGGGGAQALESQTSTNKLEAPSAYQRSPKCMKTLKKFNFIKIVFVSISINRDMVLKWKLGQLVWMDLLPLKRISFSSTVNAPSFDSTVITLSRDIVHKFEKLTFAGKK